MCKNIKSYNFIILVSINTWKLYSLIDNISYLLIHFCNSLKNNLHLPFFLVSLIYYLMFICTFSEESNTEESFSSQTADIPQSLSLLFLGHEYLGK